MILTTISKKYSRFTASVSHRINFTAYDLHRDNPPAWELNKSILKMTFKNPKSKLLSLIYVNKVHYSLNHFPPYLGHSFYANICLNQFGKINFQLCMTRDF